MNIETRVQAYTNVDGQIVVRVRLCLDGGPPTEWMSTVVDRRSSRDLASQVLMRQGADGRERIRGLAAGDVSDPGPLSVDDLDAAVTRAGVA